MHRLRCVVCVAFVAYRSLRTHRLRCVACVAFVAYRSLRTHRLRCVACVAFVALRSLHTDRNVHIGCVALHALRSLHTDRYVCIGCVALHALRSLHTLHTNRVSHMHSVVCIVYVERYVQTIDRPRLPKRLGCLWCLWVSTPKRHPKKSKNRCQF